MLAAIAAATAMVSSCSDNDVLEGVKDTGIPFSVTASTNSGGSRGSDITTLSNFQLWGFGTDQESHFDGDNFTPKAGSSTVFVSSDNTPNWPNTSNCLFYGISNNTSTMAYGVDAGSPGINTTKLGIRNGSFDYTIPTNVADQEDLLVAAATGNSNDGVQLKFDHALTAAKLHLMLSPAYTEYGSYYEHGVGTDYCFVMKVRKIIIHNLKVSGTYTFDGSNKDGDNYINGSWNTSAGNLGNYVLDFGSDPYFVQALSSEGEEAVNEGDEVIYNAKAASDDIVGTFYFIPQTIIPWEILPNNGEDISTPGTDANKAYIEFEAISMVYVPQDVIDYLDVLVNNNIDTDPESLTGLLDPNGWTKNASGDYLYNGDIVAKSNGVVVDFNNEVLNDNFNFGGQPTIETYNFTDGVPAGTYSDINDDSLYGTFYTPFRATLGVNGIRNLKVNMERGVRNDDGSSGVYGMGANPEG